VRQNLHINQADDPAIKRTGTPPKPRPLKGTCDLINDEMTIRAKNNYLLLQRMVIPNLKRQTIRHYEASLLPPPFDSQTHVSSTRRYEDRLGIVAPLIGRNCADIEFAGAAWWNRCLVWRNLQAQTRRPYDKNLQRFIAMVPKQNTSLKRPTVPLHNPKGDVRRLK